MKRLVLFLIFMFATAIVLGQGIRLLDYDSDATNASFTHAIQTGAATSFDGYYWGFALNADASGVCTLRTYYNDVCDQTNGVIIYPGGGHSWLTYQPVLMDSFAVVKTTATDVFTWMISGR